MSRSLRKQLLEKLKCHIRGGGGVRKVPKRCHVLFEGPLMADIGATVSEIGWGFKTI